MICILNRPSDSFKSQKRVVHVCNGPRDTLIFNNGMRVVHRYNIICHLVDKVKVLEYNWET